MRWGESLLLNDYLLTKYDDGHNVKLYKMGSLITCDTGEYVTGKVDQNSYLAVGLYTSRRIHRPVL